MSLDTADSWSKRSCGDPDIATFTPSGAPRVLDEEVVLSRGVDSISHCEDSVIESLATVCIQDGSGLVVSKGKGRGLDDDRSRTLHDGIHQLSSGIGWNEVVVTDVAGSRDLLASTDSAVSTSVRIAIPSGERVVEDVLVSTHEGARVAPVAATTIAVRVTVNLLLD